MADKVYNRKIRNMEEELLRPSSYIEESRSHHMVMNEIPECFQYWLAIPEDKLRAIQNIMRMFLNCTLMWDDIVDKAYYRRNIPAAHRVYGVPLTLNATMHILGTALEAALELGDPMAIGIFISKFMEIVRGQGMDIYWRENLICASEEEYKKMAERKSSAMFILPVMLMQLFSSNKTDYSKFLTMFGVYYSIRDDYCNLVQQEQLDGHERKQDLQILNRTTFCEDLTDGKFTWPVLHALNSPEANTIIYMLKQRTDDMGIKQYFLKMLQRLGSLKYTSDVLHEYDRELRAELTSLGGNPGLEAILDDLKN